MCMMQACLNYVQCQITYLMIPACPQVGVFPDDTVCRNQLKANTSRIHTTIDVTLTVFLNSIPHS